MNNDPWDWTEYWGGVFIGLVIGLVIASAVFR